MSDVTYKVIKEEPIDAPADGEEKKVIGRPFAKGNPGRPKGARNKLSDAFIADLYADFEEHGKQAIADARRANPVQYVRICASLTPRNVNFKQVGEFEELTDDEIDRRIACLEVEIARTGHTNKYRKLYEPETVESTWVLPKPDED